jgi:hypothetical protein
MTTLRTITAAEALAYTGDEDALPYRVLTAAGRQAVAMWVHSVAREPQRHSLDAWYETAEDAAGDASPGEAVIIEMRGHQTASGRPETLLLDDECMAWQVMED